MYTFISVYVLIYLFKLIENSYLIDQIAALQHQRGDEPQHIARLLERGELPVVTLTVGHGPGDEGPPRHRRPENNRGELDAILECMLANLV